MAYYSDRHQGPAPRVATEIPEPVSNGIVGLIRNRANDGSFGLDYPEPCPDGRGPIGTDKPSVKRGLPKYATYFERELLSACARLQSQAKCRQVRTKVHRYGWQA